MPKDNRDKDAYEQLALNLNPDFDPPKEEKRRRKKKTEEALQEVAEKIIDVEYSEVMQKSYLDYSMSVITARALPDVRDGLKPVQRRIIYDMHELGVGSDKPYRKVARIAGDTMGKYHPHGDMSISGALVNLAQDFRNNAPLVDGQGNFGSIEGDGAAAARYIEARMMPFTEDVLLHDIKENTVDFVANYDGTEKEPAILPARMPNLLINGCEGIAVGMATNIPMHSVGEVVDAAILKLENEKATTQDLMQFISGPDFPTGGIIANADDLPSVYESGSGRLRIRGKVSVEKEGGKPRIVISEIPYTMVGEGIGKFMQQVATLAETRVLPEVSDITNQSSKEGIRIVIDLKKDSDAQRVINILYKKTKLEDTFGYNCLAIASGKPETMSLADVLGAFVSFQYEIYTRKFTSLLEKARKKAEIDEGLLKAIDVIDTIIEVLRGSKTVQQAKECLLCGEVKGIQFRTDKAQKEAEKFSFTQLQAESILELRLQRLVGLELTVIQEDYERVKKSIRRYERLLGSKAEMRKEIKGELITLKEKYAVPRKTVIAQLEEVEIQKEEEVILPATVVVDRFYYIKALDPAAYEKNREQIDSESRFVFTGTSTDKKLIVFTDTGKAHTVKVKDLPYGKVKDKGVPVESVSGYNGKTEQIVAIHEILGKELIFVSSDGYVKRVSDLEFDTSRKSIDSTKLSDGAAVVSILRFTGETVQLTSAAGYRIRFRQEDIPAQGKAARGATGLRLKGTDKVVEASAESRMRITKRGGSGIK